ncbi:hypothetical protein GMO_04700 [Gluconobacter morbifer G707]|uniref:Uncharacterized protein n=1 Tax=Gluconobacter morbifer G707 TaxID=1088869 RepID=G6XG55_9PROT|nr:hypothetical protein GMO_04700 [Gluconobacter morbifer G707]
MWTTLKIRSLADQETGLAPWHVMAGGNRVDIFIIGLLTRRFKRSFSGKVPVHG